MYLYKYVLLIQYICIYIYICFDTYLIVLRIFGAAVQRYQISILSHCSRNMSNTEHPGNRATTGEKEIYRKRNTKNRKYRISFLLSK